MLANDPRGKPKVIQCYPSAELNISVFVWFSVQWKHHGVLGACWDPWAELTISVSLVLVRDPKAELCITGYIEFAEVPWAGLGITMCFVLALDPPH